MEILIIYSLVSTFLIWYYKRKCLKIFNSKSIEIAFYKFRGYRPSYDCIKIIKDICENTENWFYDNYYFYNRDESIKFWIANGKYNFRLEDSTLKLSRLELDLLYEIVSKFQTERNMKIIEIHREWEKFFEPNSINFSVIKQLLLLEAYRAGTFQTEGGFDSWYEKRFKYNNH